MKQINRKSEKDSPKDIRDNGDSHENIDVSLGEPSSISETSEAIISEPTKTEDLPSRHFTGDGSEWIVRVAGQTSTGSTSDSGARLLHLIFYRSEDPLVAQYELITPCKSIDNLHDSDLENLLSLANPD